MKESFS